VIIIQYSVTCRIYNLDTCSWHKGGSRTQVWNYWITVRDGCKFWLTREIYIRSIRHCDGRLKQGVLVHETVLKEIPLSNLRYGLWSIRLQTTAGLSKNKAQCSTCETTTQLQNIRASPALHVSRHFVCNNIKATFQVTDTHTRTHTRMHAHTL
jgi:hypothetical protein